MANGPFEKVDTQNISEYGVGQEYKLVKLTFEVDNSENNINRLSYDSKSEWKTVTDFLNVLVEGESATLYSYTYRTGKKYFYTVPEKNITSKQLVYKQFLIREGLVGTNDYYKQQLVQDVACEDKTYDDFRDTRYEESALIPIFINYNECRQSTYTKFTNKTGKKLKAHFAVLAGVYNTSFGIEIKGNSNSEPAVVPRVGLEYGFTVPSEKWSFFTRVEYQKQDNEVTITYPLGSYAGVKETYQIDASVITLYFGARHFIRAGSGKVYIDASGGLAYPFGNITLNDEVSNSGGIIQSGEEYKLTTTFCFNFGAGYAFNDKISADVRYEAIGNLMSNASSKAVSSLNGFGVSVKYSLL